VPYIVPYFPYLQVLKIAILSEKYAHDYTWYVDTILNLIRLAGDYVSEEVWYRIVQVVINTQEVQGYAAKTCFEVSRELVSKRCVHIRLLQYDSLFPLSSESLGHLGGQFIIHYFAL
jgi:hypothetical protein